MPYSQNLFHKYLLIGIINKCLESSLLCEVHIRPSFSAAPSPVSRSLAAVAAARLQAWAPARGDSALQRGLHTLEGRQLAQQRQELEEGVTEGGGGGGERQAFRRDRRKHPRGIFVVRFLQIWTKEPSTR